MAAEKYAEQKEVIVLPDFIVNCGGMIGCFTEWKYRAGLLSGEKKYEDNVIFPIVEDRNGKIWLGTFKGGLSRFDPKTEQYKHYVFKKNSNSLPDNSIQDIFEDSEGYLWIGTFQNGLTKLGLLKEKALFGRIAFSVNLFSRTFIYGAAYNTSK